MPEISIVLPTYEEGENILEMLRRLDRVLNGKDYELLVVDDDSPDGTWRLAEDHARGNARVRVVRRITDRGLSSAILEGFRQARGEILGVMDADQSHDEKVLPQMIGLIHEGADVVIASRRIPGGGADRWPWVRRFTSDAATRLSRSVLPMFLSDPMSGYFLIRREIYQKVRDRLRPRGYKILLEIVVRAHPVKIREVPFIFKDRRSGHSKLSAFVILNYLESLFDLRWGGRPLDRLRELYHRGRYKKVAAHLQPGRLLDLGCGRPCDSMPDGAFLREVGRGTGLDIKPCSGPFDFCRGEVRHLPFSSERFQNVTAMEILEHADDLPGALNDIHRALAPGGTLIVTVPDDNLLWKVLWSLWTHLVGRMWKHAHHVHLTKSQWKRKLQERFHVLEVRRHWYFDLVFLCRK
ncbi:MAG: glycosyltransferase [Elusimicrobia bacterium]|nr:glycosyltransferase [Elusimicrobiota bacterium]